MSDVDRVTLAQRRARAAFAEYAAAVSEWLEAANASDDHPTFAKTVVAAESHGVTVVAGTGAYGVALRAWCKKNDKTVEVPPDKRGGE